MPIQTRRDSDGYRLSQEQWEFFKDSQLKDSEGYLLRLYHGNNVGGISTFNDSDSGLYFVTSDADYAECYGENIYDVYVNAKNLFDIRKPSCKKFIYSLGDRFKTASTERNPENPYIEVNATQLCQMIAGTFKLDISSDYSDKIAKLHIGDIIPKSDMDTGLAKHMHGDMADPQSGEVYLGTLKWGKNTVAYYVQRTMISGWYLADLKEEYRTGDRKHDEIRLPEYEPNDSNPIYRYLRDNEAYIMKSVRESEKLPISIPFEDLGLDVKPEQIDPKSCNPAVFIYLWQQKSYEAVSTVSTDSFKLSGKLDLSNGVDTWTAIETTVITDTGEMLVDAMGRAGYDCARMREMHVDTFAVFNKNQIKFCDNEYPTESDSMEETLNATDLIIDDYKEN